MADLIDLDFAKLHIGQNSYTETETTLLTSLITAASQEIEAFCRRAFSSETFDELYDGHDQPKLVLRHYPILSVQRISFDPTTVLTVHNVDPTFERATVQVTSSALVLTRYEAGESTARKSPGSGE